MNRRNELLLIGLLVLSRAVAGCGDDGEAADAGMDTDADSDTDSDTDSDVDTDSDTCAEFHDALQDVLDEQADQPNVPGAILGINTPDCGDWLGSTGLAFTDPAEPMLPEHQYLLGSITKTYTAAVILQLVDEELLSLEDTLDQWYDAIPNAAEITIEQMLNHTAGIFNYINDPEFVDDFLADPGQVWTPEEILSYILDETPDFAPGEGWEYSNSGYLLLGMIIEDLTGGTAGEAFHLRLLDPTSLGNTFFSCEEEAPGPMCGHYLEGTDVIGVFHTSWSWTAGAMGSAALDQLEWCRALFTGDVLSDEIREQMLVFEPTGQPGWSWGLGPCARTNTVVGEIWGHDGRGPGVQSELWYAPDLDVCISAFVNVTPEEAPNVSRDIVLTGVLPLLSGSD